MTQEQNVSNESKTSTADFLRRVTLSLPYRSRGSAYGWLVLAMHLAHGVSSGFCPWGSREASFSTATASMGLAEFFDLALLQRGVSATFRDCRRCIALRAAHLIVQAELLSALIWRRESVAKARAAASMLDSHAAPREDTFACNSAALAHTTVARSAGRNRGELAAGGGVCNLAEGDIRGSQTPQAPRSVNITSRPRLMAGGVCCLNFQQWRSSAPRSSLQRSLVSVWKQASTVPMA
jgi:hypothetical protein